MVIERSGTNPGVDIGDVDVASIIPGTGATNLGKAEDAVHASGDTGTLALVVRQDTAAQLAGTDGDYSALVNDANGRLHVLDANSAAVKTAVELIDNAISGTEMQVDVVAALPTGTNAIGRVGHDTTGLGHGVKTVTTVGTDEALAGSTACKWVTIQAQTDNTNKVAVGATGVDATVATGNGLILDPGDWTPKIDIDNLADVFIDALVAGEGVRYIYGT